MLPNRVAGGTNALGHGLEASLYSFFFWSTQAFSISFLKSSLYRIDVEIKPVIENGLKFRIMYIFLKVIDIPMATINKNIENLQRNTFSTKQMVQRWLKAFSKVKHLL